ncbi:uncharacterized protein LOC123890815 [Trifolium pratense]|uniref:uncharacterized protein LOC123890815 n=2 Tax=Trifolium pratense TaxID=57577 RepID=UPI001E69573D|nr:uncharacterized protein LOC123890815 [Trifolium pratense]
MEPPKEAWADIEVRNATSKYSDFNLALACITNLSHPATRKLFDIRPCYEGDAVCDSPSTGECVCFTYVYYCTFLKLGVCLPFTDFQCEILNTLNVAPTQLHPNCWGFIRAFEILCGGLGLPLSTYSFFSCFQAKSIKRNSWIYMANKAKHTLITPLTSSWKNFKNDFLRVSPSPTSPLWYDDSGVPFFPFHWTKRPVTKPDLRSLPHSVDDMKAIAKLRTMQTVTVAELLLYENNAAQLSTYLRSKEMVMTNEERARIWDQVDEEVRGPQLDAHKDQSASIPAGSTSPTSPRKKKSKRKNIARNEIVLAAPPAHVSPRPAPRIPIRTCASSLPANNWRAKLAIDDRGGESESAWDVHFSGEGVTSQYTTSSDVQVIKELGFEQTLEAMRTYNLWSASLATETCKTLREERTRYLENLRTKTGEIDTLKASLKTVEDELETSHAKFSELESKMKSLKVSYERKDKKLEDNAKELEKNNKEIEKKDKCIHVLERSSVEEFELGFARALEQVEILHPGLDTRGANSRFVVENGRIVNPKARSTFGVVTGHRST